MTESIEVKTVEIKPANVFYLSARCTCPNCNKTTAVDSKELADKLIKCYHCDVMIVIKE